MTSKPPRRSRLGPEETVQRFLLSTTSRFVGGYETETFEFQHAWPQFNDRKGTRRFDEGPTSRSAYVLLFETQPISKEIGVALPTYEYGADIIVAWLGVLYGKRFDGHGALQQSGFLHLPDLTLFGTTCLPDLPWNSHAPRVDLRIPLNLVEIGRFKALLDDLASGSTSTSTFNGAALFYARALQAAERDPEVAYLHLITAGEILANATFPEFDESLLDDEMKTALGRISSEMPDGDKLARAIRKRLLQVKRRFVATITGFIDDAFFTRTETKHSWAAFKVDTFPATIGAAYDLRSRYVHTGVAFGMWIDPGGHYWLPETQGGQPVVSDPEMAKILARAPTFIGLERVIRYCLIQFAGKLGADVSEVPDSATL